MGKLSFGTTGYSYEVDKVDMKVTGAPRCPRCKDRVFYNEEKKALNKSWHKRCFSCAQCHKSLESANYNSHEEEVYCPACHRRCFGPQGYGFAGGAAGLQATQPDRRTPTPPGMAASQTTTAAPTKTAAEAVAPQKDTTHPECCPRCGLKVYFAEEVKLQRRKYHKLCFKCMTCSKLCEPGRCNAHQGELYCQSCYGRQFGPRGYGFAGGAGTVMVPTPVNSRTPRYAHTTHVIRQASPVQESPKHPSTKAQSQEWTEAIFI